MDSDYKSVVKSLTDNFNADNILVIEDMVAHDMWALTYDRHKGMISPAARVSSYRGSGNVKLTTIYDYLISLHKNYGHDNPPEEHAQFAFAGTPGFDKPAMQMSLLGEDGMLGKSYLRIITTPEFLGFQSYGVNEYSPAEKAGPVVWFDKKLPKVLKQARSLDRFLKNAELQPYIPEVV